MSEVSAKEVVAPASLRTAVLTAVVTAVLTVLAQWLGVRILPSTQMVQLVDARQAASVQGTIEGMPPFVESLRCLNHEPNSNWTLFDYNIANFSQLPLKNVQLRFSCSTPRRIAVVTRTPAAVTTVDGRPYDVDSGPLECAPGRPVHLLLQDLEVSHRAVLIVMVYGAERPVGEEFRAHAFGEEGDFERIAPTLLESYFTPR